MKKNLMFGAAVVAAALTPALAHADETRGSLGVHYGKIDPQGSSQNISDYGIDGSLGHDFDNSWTVQGDASTGRLHASGNSVGTSFSAVSAGVRGDNHAVYGFVGLTDVFGASATAIGAGGQLALSNIILNGSVGVSDVDNADLKVKEVSIDGTYFFNDNLGVTLNYSHESIDTTGPDVDGNTYGLSGTYRFASCPVNLSLGYEKHDLDGGDVNAWRIGASWQFGTSSVRDQAQHDLNGARALFNQTQLIF